MRTQALFVEGLHCVIRAAHRLEFRSKLSQQSSRNDCQHAVTRDFCKGAHSHTPEGQNWSILADTGRQCGTSWSPGDRRRDIAVPPCLPGCLIPDHCLQWSEPANNDIGGNWECAERAVHNSLWLVFT